MATDASLSSSTDKKTHESTPDSEPEAQDSKSLLEEAKQFAKQQTAEISKEQVWNTSPELTNVLIPLGYGLTVRFKIMEGGGKRSPTGSRVYHDLMLLKHCPKFGSELANQLLVGLTKEMTKYVAFTVTMLARLQQLTQTQTTQTSSSYEVLMARLFALSIEYYLAGLKYDRGNVRVFEWNPDYDCRVVLEHLASI